MADQDTASISVQSRSHRGLTAAEPQLRLKQYGPNTVVEEKTHTAIRPQSIYYSALHKGISAEEDSDASGTT